MNLNKIGNILCLATSVFLTFLGAAASSVLIAFSPSLLEQLDAIYIVPFAAGTMTAIFIFVLAEILVVIGVIGVMSSRNRRNGFLGIIASAIFIGITTFLIFYVIDLIVGVGGDPFMMMMIALAYYMALGAGLGYLLGSVLKILHKGE